MWDGDVIAGPVPTFFADAPEEAMENLKSDLAKAHWDLNRLYKVFFSPEHIDAKEAQDLVKKPRYFISKYLNYWLITLPYIGTFC